jgi:serine/threonine-protein kinase
LLAVDTTVGGQQVPPIPQRIMGPYHLLAQLGQTPTGPVYLARLQHKETLFALKLLPPLGPDELARMRQDSSHLSRVEHPGVVRPVDMGVDRGRAYVVTEHVPGTTLREQLDRRGPLPPRQAARLAADIADALQAIHDAGVVHRHLDPSVIVVDGRDGRPKLAELGAARDPRRPPLPGQAPYLPFCMAPEQLRGERAEAKSDVYALGAVLYELLSGSPPFEGQSWSELSQEIQAGDPEPPSDLVAGIPRKIEKACLRALELSPDDRPSAAELAQELRRAAGADSDATSSPAVLVGLVVALLAAAGAGAWGWVERGGRTKAEGELATSRVEADGLRKAVEDGAKARADLEAAAKLAREQATRKQQDTDASLAQVRAEAAQAKAGLDQLRRAYEQRLELSAQAQAGAAGAPLAAVVDGTIAALESQPEQVALRARLLLNRARLDDLAALLKAEREKGPLEPELLYLEFTTERDPARAEALLKELAALDEASPYGAIGRIYSQENLPLQGAMAALQKALQQSPRDPHLLLLTTQVAGDMALQSNNGQLLQQALQLADQAVAANPTSPNAYAQRARVCMSVFQLTQGQRREFATRALGDLRVARLFAEAPAFWTEAAKCYLALSLPELALAELTEGRRRAQAQGSQNELARSYALMGAAHLLRGDEASAVNSWTDALRSYPTLQGTYDFVQYLPGLSAAGQQRVLQAAPANVRPQLEDVLRQAQRQGPR